MFMTPWESLAPYVLLLEQKSYLPHVKKLIIEIFKTIDLLHFHTYTLKSILQFLNVTSTTKL